MRLVDVAPKNSAVSGTAKPTCPTGEFLINSNNPQESVMLKRLRKTQACGDAMPPAGLPISAADLKCLEDWILSF
jgi:hypothetical protein